MNEADQLLARVRALSEHSANLKNAFEYFDLAIDSPEKGAPEIGILIPKTPKSQQLDVFIGELKDINFLLRTFSELTNSAVGEVKVRKIASSNFLFDFVPGAATTVLALAGALQVLLACYQKILEIKKTSADAKRLDAPLSVSDAIESWASDFMRKEIDIVAADLTKTHLKDSEVARRNEIQQALRTALAKTMSKIDQGHGYQIRVAPNDNIADEPAVGESGEAKNGTFNQQLAKIAPLIHFQRNEGPPLLALPAANVDEEESLPVSPTTPAAILTTSSSQSIRGRSKAENPKTQKPKRSKADVVSKAKDKLSGND